MPRYFFHFVHRDGWVRDGEGTELPDLRGAHAHANLLLEQATGSFDDLSDWRGWQIRITDADDRPALFVLFPTVGSAAELYREAEACRSGPPRRAARENREARGSPS
jgi:hypothetical protein